MSDATGRTLRTLLQTLVGFVVAGGLTEIVNAYADQFRVVGANRLLLAAALTILVTFAQNVGEQRGWVPTLLKPPTPPPRRRATPRPLPTTGWADRPSLVGPGRPVRAVRGLR